MYVCMYVCIIIIIIIITNSKCGVVMCSVASVCVCQCVSVCLSVQFGPDLKRHSWYSDTSSEYPNQVRIKVTGSRSRLQEQKGQTSVTKYTHSRVVRL